MSQGTGPIRPIGFWLKLVDRLIDERFEQTLGASGVPRRQWQLLNVVARGPVPESEIDEALSPFLDAAEGETAARHLRGLEDRGLVVGGSEGYRLTGEGADALGELRQQVERDRGAITRGIDADEYERTLATLERMARNLGWEG